MAEKEVKKEVKKVKKVVEPEVPKRILEVLGPRGWSNERMLAYAKLLNDK
jgi:hypothetical protein